jgi:fatty acid-binding protein DegV
MSKVAVVTDSVANLPPELVERYSITIIPLLVAFGQEVFRDGVDMTPAAVLPPTAGGQTPAHHIHPFHG